MLWSASAAIPSGFLRETAGQAVRDVSSSKRARIQDELEERIRRLHSDKVSVIVTDPSAIMDLKGILEARQVKRA